VQVLHLAPHPDDELIGAPATLMALRDAGHTVVNVACSLGRAEDRERRTRELERASARARFELVVPERTPAMSSDDDLDAAQAELGALLEELIGAYGAELVVSPSPHDGHPGHEVVGRAARDVLERRPLRWWMWGVWADLPLPTLLVPFDEARLEEILYALEAHEGELTRNDYRALVHGRAMANRVLGPERVFGYGAAGENLPYAEVVTETARVGGLWRRGSAGRLTGDPAPYQPGVDISWWVEAESVSQRLAVARLRS
jgi:LmbE family N-acetylglucosaminyl deacetylase